MELDQARHYIADHHRAILATTRADGRPQLSPVVCAVGPDGRVWISTRETAVKTRNLERWPEVSLCVFDDGFFGQWVQVDGRAAIVHLPEALELLVEYYRLLAGEHPDWDDYRSAMAREQRVLLQVTVERAGPDRHG